MNRRGFITGFASFLAAPAIVRVSSLMPISALRLPTNLTATEIVNRTLIATDIENAWIEELSQRMVATIIYGNQMFCSPQQFTGFHSGLINEPR